MKSLLFFITFSLLQYLAFAQFTTGSIVMVRIGDGVNTLTTTSPVFLDEYTTTGELIQSVPMPTSTSGTNNQFLINNNSSVAGMLNLSSDRRYLTLGGLTTGTNKVIARVDKNENINTNTVLSLGYDIRSVTSTDGTKFWFVGNSGGVQFTNLGSITSTQICANQINNRHITIENNQLYVSTGSSNPYSRIGTTATGLPENTGDTLASLSGLPTSGSALQFILIDQNTSIAGYDVLYVAFDGTINAGIQKYSLVNNQWVTNGAVVGTVQDAYRGITGQIDITNPNHIAIYATRKAGISGAGGGELVLINDYSGYNGQLTATPYILATAPVNMSFRGLALSPETLPVYTPATVFPKMYLSKAVLNVNQTQVITGKDFTPNGQVNLVISNNAGDFIPINSITYLPNGGFDYQLPITSAMLNGEYTVYATDINSGKTSSTSRFRVNNPLVQKLWVTSPSSVDGYFTGTEIQIRWGDFISNSNAIASTGFVQKRYKIERSNNGGSSWQTIASNKLFTKVPSNQIMEFSFSYSFPQAGTYIVKITDLDNTADNNTSIAFIVTAAGSQSFTPTLHWDNRISALSTSMPNPIGLAADGTSRIIVRLTKNPANTKTVKEIYANISDPSGIITSGTDLLGKIIPAKIITPEYNDEANNAFATNCDTIFAVPSPNPSFSFWLVSPDDFTQTANSLSSERVIKVTFTITYSDNTTSTIYANSIKIVRPPLLMIHGINSSGKKAWENAKFKIGSSTYKFKDLIDAGSVWKYGLMPNLLSYGSYLDNATILLGNSDKSFRSVLNNMQKKGFASCKVDYICHSMGGAIARTAIRLGNWYYLDKNYHKGYINKLVTINTPHNGSYIADFFVKYFESISTSMTAGLGNLYQQLNGFFDPNDYKPSPAIFNLEAKAGGITFSETVGVKNHLIASDIDAGNITSIDKIDLDNFGTALMLPMLNSANVPWKYYHNIPKYILEKYGNTEYFSNTDVVVPVSSQLPQKVPGVIDIIDANTISGTLPNSKIYSTLYQNPFIHTIDATTVSHTAITENLTVGSRVMFLLNSAISSGSFENTIPANTNTGGAAVYSPLTIADATDSVFSYIDTAHLKIASPGNNTNVYVDSTLNINVLISDTAGFKNVRLIFQGETYESSSKITNQTFNFNVHSDAIGKNTLVAKGLYDSLGYTIYHSDTVFLKVISKDTLEGLYVTPKSQNLNKNHFFHPTYNAIYTTYIGTLNNNIDSLTFTIADTNVVQYIDSLKYFVTKDTGTTHIIFNYKGFIDSAFIYVGIPLNENITTTCSSGTLYFYAGSNDTSKTYQWQVDSANGFENIIPGIHYSGVDSCTLTLTNAPSNWYNYRYRCLISDSIGSTSSPVFTLRFSVTWTGAVDTAWGNPANWTCANLPDSNIDVIIPTGKPRYPQVNTNVACRSVDVQHGAAVLVKTGFMIDITGKNQ